MRKLIVLVICVLVVVGCFPVFVSVVSAATPAGTITYNAGSDTITVVGANSSHPCEFLDLFNADVAGGWGQVTMQGTNQFLVACKIVIGNGTSAGATYFTDSDKEVVFSSVVFAGAWENVFYVRNYAVVTLGVVVDVVSKGVVRGVSFMDSNSGYNHWLVYLESGGVAYFYASSFSGLDVRLASVCLRDNGRVWSCRFNQYSGVVVYGGDVFNSQFGLLSNSGNAFELYSSSASFNRIYCSYGHNLLYTMSVYNFTVNGLFGRNYSHLLNPSSWSGNGYMVDCDVDAWSFVWSGTSSGEVYRQVSFDLFVLNGALTDFVEDANVTLLHDGVVFGSWLANSTGQIPTQVLTYGFYNQSGGDVMYGGTAWTLNITHVDWASYESKFYPYSEIDWSISMQNVSVVEPVVVIVAGEVVSDDFLLAGLLVGCLAFLFVVVLVRRKR